MRRQPKQARSRAAVAAILQAAAQVLAREGYERATTNHVAEVAGVSIGTLYQYFDDKDAVFDALAEALLGEMVVAVGDGLRDDGAALPARLERIATAVFVVVARYPGVLRQLDAAAGSTFRARLSDAKGRARELFEATLRRTDDVRVRDPALAARLLSELAEGVLYNLAAGDDTAALARELTVLATRYLTG